MTKTGTFGAVIGKYPEAFVIAMEMQLPCLRISPMLWSFLEMTGQSETAEKAFISQATRGKNDIIVIDEPSEELRRIAQEITAAGGSFTARSLSEATYAGELMKKKPGMFTRLIGKLDKKIVGKWQEELVARFNNDFGFLFEEASARIVPNLREYPSVNGGAIVTADVGDFYLRAVRDKGVVRFDIAPKSHPNEWSDLEFVLNTLPTLADLRGSTLTSKVKLGLRELSAAFSSSQYDDTRESLEASRRALIQKFKANESD